MAQQFLLCGRSKSSGGVCMRNCQLNGPCCGLQHAITDCCVCRQTTRRVGHVHAKPDVGAYVKPQHAPPSRLLRTAPHRSSPLCAAPGLHARAGPVQSPPECLPCCCGERPTLLTFVPKGAGYPCKVLDISVPPCPASMGCGLVAARTAGRALATLQGHLWVPSLSGQQVAQGHKKRGSCGGGVVWWWWWCGVVVVMWSGFVVFRGKSCTPLCPVELSGPVGRGAPLL
jgi:hypothetical protein